MQVYLVGALLFALLVAIFAVQNSALVNIRFLTWEFQQISLVIVILGSAAVGAVFVLFLGLLKQFSLVRSLRNMRAENKRLSEHLARLSTVDPQPEKMDKQMQELDGEEPRVLGGM